MTNKKKIVLAIVVSIIGSFLSVLIINWDMINATYKLCRVEMSLSYYVPQLEESRYETQELTAKVNSLHKERGQLDSKRKDLASIYMPADQAISEWYIIIEEIN